MPKRKLVVIGLLGTTLDAGRGSARWDRWRPTVALTQHDDLVVDRLDLLLGKESRDLGVTVTADILHASPETRVVEHLVDFKDAWDFERVYGTLLDFAKSYAFNPDAEDYLVHITTGTHVAQICLFLLTESRHIPARLLQTSPLRRGDGGRGEARRGPGPSRSSTSTSRSTTVSRRDFGRSRSRVSRSSRRALKPGALASTR